jgi:two-component system, OmpR family, phosphate regulon sensor histidine kinase PhoR
MRRHRSLLSQMLIAFSAFAVLVGGAMAVGYLAVVHQHQATDRLTGHYQVLQETAGKMKEAFDTAQAAVLGYAMTRESGFLRPLDGARAQFDQRLATARGQAGNLRGPITAQGRAGSAWFALAPKIMAAAPGTPAARAVLGQSAALTGAFIQANTQMQVSLTRQIGRLNTTSDRALVTGLAWSAAVVGLALVLVLAGSLSTLSTVARPLRGLAATVRRLTSGDYAARAAVAGSAEVREVARVVNAQADESDRLREQEAQSNRLRAVARDGGLRIREHLAAGDVIREAQSVLRESVDADMVALMLVNDERIEPAAGQPDADRIAESFTPAQLSGSLIGLRELFRGHASELVQDMAAPDGQLPPWAADGLRAAGVGSHLLTPFGVGEQMLGFVTANRLGPGRPWSAAEAGAVESIAADIGRGLHHARLYEAENRLVEDLKSLDQAKSDFFATVSHELRAPLTSIEGYVEMLAEGEGGPVTGEQRKMLDVVDHSAVRLRNLIEDVFTLSKLESDAFTTVMRPVEVAHVISAAADELAPEVARHGLTLASDCPGRGLAVDGDAGQLGRVLVNLLSNAVKFTPEGGRITLTAAAAEGSAVITVTDTGIGIPAKDQEELFTRFFRASNAVQQSIPGTGLGLAIVRTIVTNHGGTIDLTSREGQGTTFTVRIPLAAEGRPAVGAGSVGAGSVGAG